MSNLRHFPTRITAHRPEIISDAVWHSNETRRELEIRFGMGFLDIMLIAIRYEGKEKTRAKFAGRMVA